MHGRMADRTFRAAALAAVHDEPVRAINELVEELRADRRGWVPYVAPTYGGVTAELLLLFRDPGPMTNPDNAGSGFLSAENDDESARRCAWLLDTVGVSQARCVSWNAYPWYINRKPGPTELDAGLLPLRRLLGLLPRLRVVLLCGADAQDSWKRLRQRYNRVAANYTPIPTYHTSQQAFWVAEPEQSARKLRQLYAFADAAAHLDGRRGHD